MVYQYKKKISPVRVPFSSHDKQNFRIPPGSLLYKYRAKQLEGKSMEEVQEEVQRRNELRQLVKDIKSVEKSFISQNQKNMSPVRKPQSREKGSSYFTNTRKLTNNQAILIEVRRKQDQRMFQKLIN